MKHWLVWMRDPALHLIVLAIAVLVVAGALNGSWLGFASRLGAGPNHPPGCHACSLCPPGAAAVRDAYLIGTDSIEVGDPAD
jgi:hypothetical protein